MHFNSNKIQYLKSKEAESKMNNFQRLTKLANAGHLSFTNQKELARLKQNQRKQQLQQEEEIVDLILE